ncbi:MAG: EthD domain-containing protein [Dehalococcoidales bacterium]|nr:EthD domain-containing protein [Dehalococcoidales bacterium]
MVKMITLLKRKPGISREEFSKYWLHPHGDLILRTIPGIRKYVQNPAQIKEDREYLYDGVAESWFDDMDALRNALKVMGSKAGDVVREDEEKFLDRSKISAMVVIDEREVKL